MVVTVDVDRLSSVEGKRIVVIGNFDGVHIGHQELIRRAKYYRETERLAITVLTFWPHPLSVLGREKGTLLLMPIEERLRMLKFFGVDETVVLEFNENLYNMDPEEFLQRVLIEKLRASIVIVGEDFRFGKGRKGDVKLMRDYLTKRGIYLEVVKQVYYNGMPVSSTRIRRLLKEGKVEEVWYLLGRPYRVCGEVIHGAGRGRNLGFPTANIKPINEVIPQDGVYATFVDLGCALYRGLTNIGKNPTFGGNQRFVETYILDFSGDLYGKIIAIYFVKRLRGEKKFDTIEDLKKAITKDVEEGRKYLEWERLSFGFSF